MRLIPSLLIGLPFVAAAQPLRKPATHFDIERNATLETAAILYLLAPAATPPIVGIRPLAEEARTFFAPYASHPSVKQVDSWIRQYRERGHKSWLDWVTGITIVSIASPSPVPRATYDRARIGLPDFDEDLPWADLMEAANRFYQDAPVQEFLTKSQPAYACAAAEVRALLPPPALLPAMEHYYGARLQRYTIIPEPLLNPSLNMGVPVNTTAGREGYMVMGPSVVTKDVTAFGCGYSNPDVVRPLIIHEFGHSFVNPILETPEMKAKINRYAFLYAPIKDEQTEQGMGDWFGTVIEHVVRLGEIRVLEAIGDKQGAQAKRLDEVFNRKTIYLPLLEERIKEYESNRTRYPTFQSFIDRLISAFSDDRGPTSPAIQSATAEPKASGSSRKG